jgi:hypothetical protein
MHARQLLCAAVLSAALAFGAVPAFAQAGAGPVRGAGLDAARLPARVALLRPPNEPASATVVLAADPSGQLARQVRLSEPHLYRSVPLSALLGLGGAVLGYGAGFILLNCSDEGSDCAHGPDNAEYYTSAAGLALGAAAGAHLGGLRRDSRGSFALTLLGAALGALPLVIVNKSGDLDTASALGLAAAPAGAVLVDYLVRRPRG